MITPPLKMVLWPEHSILNLVLNKGSHALRTTCILWDGLNMNISISEVEKTTTPNKKSESVKSCGNFPNPSKPQTRSNPKTKLSKLEEDPPKTHPKPDFVSFPHSRPTGRGLVRRVLRFVGSLGAWWAGLGYARGWFARLWKWFSGFSWGFPLVF